MIIKLSALANYTLEFKQDAVQVSHLKKLYSSTSGRSVIGAEVLEEGCLISIRFFQFNEWYVLYVPTSPNPTSGFTVIVHKSKVKPSTMGIEEVSSFIISVGVDFTKPEDIQFLKKGFNQVI